jgi:HEAT repeat protein
MLRQMKLFLCSFRKASVRSPSVRKGWLACVPSLTVGLLTPLISFALLAATFGAGTAAAPLILGQSNEQLTPIQREIERQRQRLKSEDIEARRDALMRLGNLKRPDASRVAAAGLADVAPIVRATATHAILSLPQAEAATLLIPLLQDKSEFVRRETAYALGETRSRSAVAPLEGVLLNDKEMDVRGAAAVALGEIGDESAVPTLSQVLAGQVEKKKKKAKVGSNVFVMRAAARSLGQIKSHASVDVLIAALANDANDNDVRREAATALGLIGDPSAGPALQSAFTSTDPYLSEAARTALRRLKSAKN